MKIIINIKTRRGKKITKKEREEAVNMIAEINSLLIRKIKGFNLATGIPYKDGVKWIWEKR